MTDQTAGGRRRRRTSPVWPPPASPLDVDDLIEEILLRVPPRPSALPRASLVCKRWLRVVSDPRFLRRFGAHHRKAPLLGYIEQRFGERDIVFSPILEPPDRIPPRHFLSLGRAVAGAAGREIDIIQLLDCRHGRVAFIDMSHREFTLFVCDTVTGGLTRLAVPPEFRAWSVSGAVLCTAGEQGHVHGACHLCPFKVVLVSMVLTDLRPIACVYSSETSMWGNVVQHDPCGIVDLPSFSTLLIGHTLYYLFCYETLEEDEDGYIRQRDGMLEFDLDTQSLTVMKGLPENIGIRRRIIKTTDGGVGLVALSYPTLQMWHRKISSHHVATWEPFKTVDLCHVLGLQGHERWVRRENIMGYDQDSYEIFISLDSSLFMVQLESMQFKRHSYQMAERHRSSFCHPFRSFYVAGTAIAGECNRYEMIQDS